MLQLNEQQAHAAEQQNSDESRQHA